MDDRRREVSPAALVETFVQTNDPIRSVEKHHVSALAEQCLDEVLPFAHAVTREGCRGEEDECGSLHIRRETAPAKRGVEGSPEAEDRDVALDQLGYFERPRRRLPVIDPKSIERARRE